MRESLHTLPSHTPRPTQSARATLQAALGAPGEADAKLSLARLLAGSPIRRESAEGLALLSDLTLSGVRQSEVQFTTCAARFLRGDYAECRLALVQLVRSEPGNERAAALLEVLRSHVAEHGKWGLLLLGLGVVVVVGGAYLFASAWAARAARDRPATGGVPSWRRAAAGHRSNESSSWFGFGGSSRDDDWSSRSRRGR